MSNDHGNGFMAIRAQVRSRPRLWLGVAISIASCIAAIAATHLELAQALRNPVVLISGAILIGLHVLGGAIAVATVFLAKKRGPR